jgi:iron uptake system component EfeO
MSRGLRGPAVAAVLLLPLALTACGSGSDDAGAGSGADGASATGAAATTVAVESSDTECLLDASSAPEGSVTFSVRNTGTAVTELYVLRADGSIVDEVEDIGPGLSRDLQADLGAGDYVVRCEPGMSGDEIDVDFVVDPA